MLIFRRRHVITRFMMNHHVLVVLKNNTPTRTPLPINPAQAQMILIRGQRAHLIVLTRRSLLALDLVATIIPLSVSPLLVQDPVATATVPLHLAAFLMALPIVIILIAFKYEPIRAS